MNDSEHFGRSPAAARRQRAGGARRDRAPRMAQETPRGKEAPKAKGKARRQRGARQPGDRRLRHRFRSEDRAAAGDRARPRGVHRHRRRDARRQPRGGGAFHRRDGEGGRRRAAGLDRAGEPARLAAARGARQRRRRACHGLRLHLYARAGDRGADPGDPAGRRNDQGDAGGDRLAPSSSAPRWRRASCAPTRTGRCSTAGIRPAWSACSARRRPARG